MPTDKKMLDQITRDWFFPSPGDKKFDHPFQFKGLPIWGRAIEEILRSRLFPFRTSGDLHRACLARGLAELALAMKKGDPVRHMMVQALAALDSLRADAEEDMHDEVIALAEKRIDRYLTRGGCRGRGRAYLALDRLKTYIEAMPGGALKEMYRASIRERFDGLGLMPEAVSLHPSQSDDDEVTGTESRTG